jgi:hypothetical protein
VRSGLLRRVKIEDWEEVTPRVVRLLLDQLAERTAFRLRLLGRSKTAGAVGRYSELSIECLFSDIALWQVRWA